MESGLVIYFMSVAVSEVQGSGGNQGNLTPTQGGDRSSKFGTVPYKIGWSAELNAVAKEKQEQVSFIRFIE